MIMEASIEEFRKAILEGNTMKLFVQMRHSTCRSFALPSLTD